MTGAEFVNIELKRFLSQNRMTENLLTYLKNYEEEIASKLFPTAGLFTYPVTITQDGAAGTFTLTPTTIEGIDNGGHVLQLTGSDLIDIPYENTAGEYYWIGMKYIEIPSGVYPNPRTSIPEYDKWQEQVGERATPDAVVDNLDGTLTITVNSVLQNGIDHSDREVMVWLVNPVSNDETVAIETQTVTYSVTNNTITTDTYLGQGTVSETAADYQVALLGLTIENTGVSAVNPFGDEYIDIGYIVGGDPGSKSDEAEELDLSGGGGHTLQRAYDGLSGSGSGKVISASDQAVEITQQNTATFQDDIAHAALRVTKDSDTTIYSSPPNPEDLEVGIDLKMRLRSHGAVLARVHLYDQTGLLIQAEEAVQVTSSGYVLTFTRGAIDLNMTGETGDIEDSFDMIEIFGSENGNNGLYIIENHDSNSCDLFDGFDRNNNASLTLETSTAMKARLYRPAFIAYGEDSNGVVVMGMNDWASDYSINSIPSIIIMPSNSAVTDVAFQISTLGVGGVFGVYSDGDVYSAKDIEATGNLLAGNTVVTTNDFAYDSTKTIYIPMSAAFGQPDDDDEWERVVLSGDRVCMGSQTTTAYINYPFRIPEGMSLVAWEAIVDDTATGTITGNVYTSGYNWTAGTFTSTSVSTGDSSDNSGSEHKIGESGLSIAGSVNNTYSLRFLANEASMYILAIRLTVETSYLRI